MGSNSSNVDLSLDFSIKTASMSCLLDNLGGPETKIFAPHNCDIIALRIGANGHKESVYPYNE